MDEQLNLAPCGYVVMDSAFRILQMNRQMKLWCGEGKGAKHIHDVLTVSSRIYFQTFFTPSVKAHGKVEEMYLILKGTEKRIPVLMNAAERNGCYECVLVQMNVRSEYENGLVLAKRQAEKLSKESAEANAQLQHLMNEVENKQHELLRLNDDLKKLASTDPLTGLNNRRYLQEKLSLFAEQAAGERTPLSVLLLDIDYFKRVNDTYGHQAGDEVLQEIGQKLIKASEESGFAARMGGEELILVYPGLSKNEAVKRAEQLRVSIGQEAIAGMNITVSIGVSSFQSDDQVASLLSRADEALYQAKKEGRNRVTAK